MKLHAGTNVIEKSGQFEESKFSIEASSKAFFILSDGLYSNKILAVVRELSTNAYDSHVEAGKADVPFDVHIPTQLEPVFSIRDYGTSMDHNSCMQLYTTYFRSTRNNSNDAVGCLGLGSKAPFAYSDSFTVEAYLDGVRRLYTAYKDEGGNPVFSLLDESSTDEKNGIKVSINVNSYDVNRFQLEATRVYEYFKVKPNFLSHQPTFKKADKILAGKNWYFDDNESNNLVIMGQIAYPIDSNQLNSEDSIRERKFIENSDGLRIFVNIGDLDITPSRESLSYSKDTKKNIVNVINGIINEISTKIEEQIHTQPSLFKARKKYVQISNQCSSISTAVESLQKSLMWNDMKLFDSVAGEYIELKGGISLSLMEKSAYRSKVDIKYSIDRMYFHENTKFFIDNLNRGGISRIRQYMKEAGTAQSCYVYKLKEGESIDNAHLLVMMGDAKREDIILTSTLDKVNYNRSSSYSGNAGPVVQAKVFNDETGHFEDCNMSVKYENAHYFAESKGSVTICHSDTEVGTLEYILDYLHKNHSDMIGDATFYIVKPSVIKNRKLEERDNWSNGAEILQTIFNHVVKINKENIIDVHRKVPLSNKHYDKWKDVLKMTANAEIAKIIDEHNERLAKVNKIYNNMHMIHDFSRKIPNVERVDFNNINLQDDRFAVRFDQEMNKYPMLKLLSVPWNDSDRKIIADYIDSIDSGLNAQNVLSRM